MCYKDENITKMHIEKSELQLLDLSNHYQHTTADIFLVLN